jgi:hypothetical protein
LITSARVGGHDANPTTTISSALEFVLSSLTAACDEKYESIPDDEIALLVTKFHALHKFCKERRRPPRGQEEEAQFLQQVRLHQPEQLQQQGRQ